MIRIPRTHITGALFYVTPRGDNGNNIFNEPDDYKFYLELLKKYKTQYGFKLFAFCLLPNHLHLLIELKEGITISDITHDLNSNYTKYFNAKYQKKGHLFQERYKLVLVEKEMYLMPLTAYIHLNPMALGLDKDVSEYEYSSYGNYVFVGTGLAPARNNETGHVLSVTIDIKQEIAEFNRLNPGVKYEDYLKDIPSQQMASLGRDLKKRQLLGSNEFIERIRQAVFNISKQAQCGPAEIKKLHSTNKKFVFAGSAVIIVLSLFTVYFYAKILGLKDNFNKELQQKDAKLSEDYRIQMDSYYKEMSKTLQVEKQKARDLEGLIEGRKK